MADISTFCNASLYICVRKLNKRAFKISIDLIHPDSGDESKSHEDHTYCVHLHPRPQKSSCNDTFSRLFYIQLFEYSLSKHLRPVKSLD